MDETGVEPMTSPMLRERATNYATRPRVLRVHITSQYIAEEAISFQFVLST
ncbi:hypothetical protein ACU8KH_00688 [Lachancea thermotolerans]